MSASETSNAVTESGYREDALDEHRRRHVAVVTFTGDSGLTDYSASLCAQLARHSDVELITAESFDDGKYKPGYRVTKVFRRTRHFPIDFWRFAWHVVRTRPDVLLLQSWLKSPTFEILWILFFRCFGIEVALTIHDLLPHYPKPWSRRVLSVYYRCFNRLIVHSDQQLKGLKAMGVDKPTLVVPHGVYDIFNTLNLSREQARAALPELRHDAYVVLFFGHLDERKGLVAFTQAAEVLKERAPSVQMVIAGKSDGRPAVDAALQRARDQRSAVIHEGRVEHEDVQKYFAACDLVALPYLEGTTSGVMKLAMAFQRPVVCTDIGDFVESLNHWPGVLISHDNLAESLSDGIAAAQGCTDLEARTVAVAEAFTWPSIADRYAGFLFSQRSA